MITEEEVNDFTKEQSKNPLLRRAMGLDLPHTTKETQEFWDKHVQEIIGEYEMTNPYEYATHRLGDEYMAKDYIGRWCYIEENGEAWPAHSNDFEQIEKDAIPIEKTIDTLHK